ncbi:TerB family tellurite resistance protein [Pseudooceanicola onchidii]|uniref:tellurite resistance TerB family protein n=1 Tax=Pseudooceanicola onchidii TaxID=2562279 RepID=UPI0010AAA044|nr:TerB family tellurite resistance protein [Pseudooceanicola onchidii]
MIADLLTRLIRPQPDPLSDTDARLALVALLVRIARSDGHFDTAERKVILQIAAERYGLGTGEAAALVTDAEEIEAQAPDTVRFTRAIKDAVAYEDRLGVIEAMWSVVLADGTRDPEEDALLRLAASLLGVTDQDSNAMRIKVASR